MFKTGLSLFNFANKEKKIMSLLIIGVASILQVALLAHPVSARNNPSNTQTKIWICHRNNAVSNRYTAQHVSVSAVNGGGNDDHSSHTGPFADSQATAQTLKNNKQKWGDVIPPFDGFPGLNWTPQSQSYWIQNCNNGGRDQCVAGAGWAFFVVDSRQGLRKDGTAVPLERSITSSVTGEPDWISPPDSGFFSLGSGGFITVGFNGYVLNENGDDLSFHEATIGRASYPEESAKIEVSQNGIDWYDAGAASSRSGVDGVKYIDFDATGLDWIQFVRITDTTNFENLNVFFLTADGYDVDAIDATNIVCVLPTPDN